MIRKHVAHTTPHHFTLYCPSKTSTPHALYHETLTQITPHTLHSNTPHHLPTPLTISLNTYRTVPYCTVLYCTPDIWSEGASEYSASPVSASDREKRGQGHGQGQGRYAEASGDRLLCYAVPYWTGLGCDVLCAILLCYVGNLFCFTVCFVTSLW
jgi:hypothetical protein